MLPKEKGRSQMGQLSMELYLRHLKKRYYQGNRAEKSKILDEFCSTSGYHRKHAIRLLRTGYRGFHKPTCRPKRYDPARLLEPLKQIWFATDQLCGKRLKTALPLWLPFYEKHHVELGERERHELLSMSAATLDRLLSPIKSGYPKGLSGTKPGSLLKTQIPIKTEQWNEKEPGFVEADTVAHCGTSLAGDFVWSLTLTDIFSGWTENRAVWNKGSEGVVTQIHSIETNLPFLLKGFDCDNGSEFLNYHLLRYFQEREKKPEFTRSRPYKKNDNAHVEQKNWTHVRQIFGYHRFEKPILVELMNDLYSNELSQLRNYFYPTIKLKSKERIGSKIKKKFEQARTPYERLMDCKQLSAIEKDKLKKQFELLDPFELQKKIQKKLKRIFQHVNLQISKRKTAI